VKRRVSWRWAKAQSGAVAPKKKKFNLIYHSPVALAVIDNDYFVHINIVT
jgi:hypothetical protein